jgi:hypothetical protein
MGLELYAVIGGGNSWPGAPTNGTLGKDLPAYVGTETQSIDSTKLILGFFNKHHADEPKRRHGNTATGSAGALDNCLIGLLTHSTRP